MQKARETTALKILRISQVPAVRGSKITKHGTSKKKMGSRINQAKMHLYEEGATKV
jgi:hypothetical protein